MNTKENNINDYHQKTNNMHIEIVNVSELEIIFILKGVDNTFANSLRRTLISNIPTLAIDNIKIKNNTSVINDEMLAQRISLLPLKYSNHLDEIGKFELCVKCPKDVTIMNINSSELKYTLDSNNVTLLYDDILLLKLKSMQEVNLEVTCKKSIGKEHSKFSPVSTVSYKKDKDNFVFAVECIGNIDPELLIKDAMDILCNS